ncbi:MAG: hypothetical protein ACRDLM_08455 [Gaiellaceae bacterium]
MAQAADPAAARALSFAAFDVDFGLGGSAFANGTGFVLLRHGGISTRLIQTRDYGRSWHIVRSWRR